MSGRLYLCRNGHIVRDASRAGLDCSRCKANERRRRASKKLSPIFSTDTPPARPGVYRWRFNLQICGWRYALWTGERWHMPNITAKRAETGGGFRPNGVMPAHLVRCGLWRGLAGPR